VLSLQKISVSVFSLLLSVISLAGDPYRITAGAAEAGSGYACLTENSFWSCFHNPALLSSGNSFSAGVNYENRFGIKELGTRTAGLIIPAGKTSLGAIYSHFGYTDFSRHMAGLACGMKISRNMAAGVQVDYYDERFAGEIGNKPALTFESGMVLQATEKVRIGIHVFNPVPGSARKRYLPSALRTGAGINLGKDLFAGAELEMSSREKMKFRCGFDYDAGKNFRMRSGFCNENTAFSFGIGYLMKQVQADIGFVTHDRLGVTSSASFIFKIK
jgi:hypothetical protein